MKAFFNGLFEYNLNSNIKYFNLLFEHEKQLSEKSIRLINHIVNAHQIWNNRIITNEAPFQVWELHKFADLKRIDAENHSQTQSILLGVDLAKIIAYKNSKGGAFENSVHDILFHIVNHSNYHRAQLASELVQLNITPPITDYIFFKR